MLKLVQMDIWAPMILFCVAIRLSGEYTNAKRANRWTRSACDLYSNGDNIQLRGPLMRPRHIDYDLLRVTNQTRGTSRVDLQPERVIERGPCTTIRRWPRGRIAYEISAAFGINQRKKICNSFEHIQTRTCIRFVKKRNYTANYVSILKQTEQGCSASSVGFSNGRQIVLLGPNCMIRRAIVHELVHIVGLFHEQMRPDRDHYVSINWPNTVPSKRSNFRKCSATEVATYGIPYNYHSIMHYGGFSFAINTSIPTIVPKNGSIPPAKLGNNGNGLTRYGCYPERIEKCHQQSRHRKYGTNEPKDTMVYPPTDIIMPWHLPFKIYTPCAPTNNTII